MSKAELYTVCNVNSISACSNSGAVQLTRRYRRHRILREIGSGSVPAPPRRCDRARSCSIPSSMAASLLDLPSLRSTDTYTGLTHFPKSGHEPLKLLRERVVTYTSVPTIHLYNRTISELYFLR